MWADTPLDLVVEHIFAARQGSAVVVDDSGVARISMIIDPCRALRNVRRRMPLVRDNAIA